MDANTTYAIAIDTTPIAQGDFTLDLVTLPATSARALLQKGLSHFLGNEVASKVTAWKKDNEGASEAEIAETLKVLRTEAIEALLAGKMGARAGAPRGTSVDTLCTRIAAEQVRAILKQQGITFPEGKDKAGNVRVLEINAGAVDDDGNPVMSRLTGADLVTRRLAHPTYGPAIRKEAERQMSAIAKVAKTEVDGGLGSSLGL